MERTIITIRENGRVNIPKGNVWMSEMELVVLFGVIAQVFQIVIRVIYKSETLTPMTMSYPDIGRHIYKLINVLLL